MIHVFCRSDLSKEQMILELSFKMKILFWSGIVLGSMSVGILSYAVVKYVGFLNQSIQPFCSFCLCHVLNFINHD